MTMGDKGLQYVQFSTQQLLEYRRLCEDAFSKVLELEDENLWKLRTRKHNTEFYDYVSCGAGSAENLENCMFERVVVPKICTSDLCSAAEVVVNQDHQSVFCSHFHDFSRRDITELMHQAAYGRDGPQPGWCIGGKVHVQKVLVQHWMYSGQWPVNARDFVLVVAFGWSITDNGNKFYMAQASIQHPQLTEQKSYVRGLINPSGAVLFRDDSGASVSICLLNNINMSGMLTPWLMKRMQSYNTKHYVKMRKYIEGLQSTRRVLVSPFDPQSSA